MSRRVILSTLKAALVGHTLPKAYPNEDFNPSLPGNTPYLAVDLVRSGTSDDTLDGVATIHNGVLIVTVVSRLMKSTGVADDHADAVAALFPFGRKIAAGDLEITIMQPPHIREGMSDGAYWRVPVRIPFIAT